MTASAFRSALASDLCAAEAHLSHLHADAYHAAVAAQRALLLALPTLTGSGRLAAQEMLSKFWRTVGEVKLAWTAAHVRRRLFLDPPSRS